MTVNASSNNVRVGWRFSASKAGFDEALELAKKNDQTLADTDNREGIFDNTHDGVHFTADFRDPNSIIVKIDQKTVNGQPATMTFMKSGENLVMTETLVTGDERFKDVLSSTDRYLGNQGGDENWEYINIEKSPILNTPRP